MAGGFVIIIDPQAVVSNHFGNRKCYLANIFTAMVKLRLLSDLTCTMDVVIALVVPLKCPHKYGTNWRIFFDITYIVYFLISFL